MRTKKRMRKRRCKRKRMIAAAGDQIHHSVSTWRRSHPIRKRPPLKKYRCNSPTSKKRIKTIKIRCKGKTQKSIHFSKITTAIAIVITKAINPLKEAKFTLTIKWIKIMKMIMKVLQKVKIYSIKANINKRNNNNKLNNNNKPNKKKKKRS